MKLSNGKRKFYPQISIEQINRNVWQITVALGPSDVKERADFTARQMGSSPPSYAEFSEAILKSLMEQDSASAGEIRREFGFSGYRCASMLSALYRDGKLTRTGRGTRAAPFRYSVRPEGVEQ